MRNKGERDPMPEAGGGWHVINAGSALDVLFHPDRPGTDGVIRKTIDVALRGNPKQALRFDPFSKDWHYHIAPVPGEGQIPLPVAEGQTPLEGALAFFAQGERFRQMLCQAEKNEHAGDGVTDEDLMAAAAQIRRINAELAA